MTSWIVWGSILILHVYFKQTDGSNCLLADTLPICTCCQSGYSGYNCTEICPNCEGRLLVNGRCIRNCLDGYYGKSCNLNCSSSCLEGNSGTKICDKDDGSCVNGCIPGRFGQQCNFSCSNNCHRNECVQKDGRCHKCKGNVYFGAHCNKTCSHGCYNGTCSRDSSCIGGCKHEYYGESCVHSCGKNCNKSICTSDSSTGFQCKDGCVKGYTTKTCATKCPDLCEECEQNSGRCISCSKYTEMHCENEDCVNGNVYCEAKGFRKEWFLLLIIPLVLLILGIILWRRRNIVCSRLHSGSGKSLDIEVDDTVTTGLLSSTQEGQHHSRSGKSLDTEVDGEVTTGLLSGTQEVKSQNDSMDKEGHTVPITIRDEITKKKIEVVKQVFVSTRSYHDVGNILDQFGHVTICGASGQGKTTMSLMLAGEYQEIGYNVIFVENIDTFNLNECVKLSPKLLLIFDDIFGSFGLSTNQRQLQNILNSLVPYLRKNDALTTSMDAEGINRSMHTTIRQEQSSDIRIVFSSKSSNFQDAMSMLQHGKVSLFSENSVVDLTTSKYYRYSKKEKVAIFDQYAENDNKSEEKISTEDINNIFNPLFGFPLTCRLFFDNASFRCKGIDFFHKPLQYLKMELKSLLNMKNGQSASLALMLLCDNKVRLPQIKLGMDQAMDPRSNLLLDIFPSIPVEEISKATTGFVGTFFSEDDFLRFAHDCIYDACACAMYDINPSFVLKYCSYDFLFAILQPVTVAAEKHEDSSNYIIVTDEYYDLVIGRIYEAIKQGMFAKSFTHPMLDKEPVVRKLFQKLQREKSEPTVVTDWIHKKDKGRGFLYWIVQGHSSRLVDEIENVLKVGFAQLEICEAVNATVEKNNVPLLKLLLHRIDNRTFPIEAGKLLLLSAKQGSPECASYLIQAGADLNTTDIKNRNCVHLACYCGTLNVLTVLLSLHGDFQRKGINQLCNAVDTDGCTPAMLVVRSGSEACFLLLADKSKPNTAIKNIWGNNVVHLACIGGKLAIVKQLVSATNINIQGQHGCTPVMHAVVNGHLSVFNFLESSNANLEIVSTNRDNILHLACQGGNIDIVKRLVSSSNINNRGRNGWTPVMKAIVSAHPDVFNFLVSNNADITVLDDGGDSILHLACQSGDTAIVQQFLSSFDINCRGNHGWTPVMKAVVSGHLDVFNLLVSNNVDLTLKSDSGDSLLHLACKGGNTSIVQKLVSPSNINCRGKYGFTPVMKAAVNGHLSVFNFLVSNNADLTMVDSSGKSLFQLACRGGNKDISKQLSPSSINNRGENETGNESYLSTENIF